MITPISDEETMSMTCPKSQFVTGGSGTQSQRLALGSHAMTWMSFGYVLWLEESPWATGQGLPFPGKALVPTECKNGGTRWKKMVLVFSQHLGIWVMHLMLQKTLLFCAIKTLSTFHSIRIKRGLGNLQWYIGHSFQKQCLLIKRKNVNTIQTEQKHKSL